MELNTINLKLVLILTVGFTLGSILGYISQKLKFSPILGYLLAGYLIGPFSPGYVADINLADQLAEVGVMLMMFGVGLHFKWQDLVKVKNIAIPGAIGQTFVATIVSAFLVHAFGGSWEVGIMIGLAIGVASTVVLVRVLSDQNLLDTLQGHIAVGWLIVEDMLTVVVLILLPTIASLLTGSSISIQEILTTLMIFLFKFVLLLAFMFTLGGKIASYALRLIARTRSQELFTLSVLALIFLIALGSSSFFGTSIALGAFIAGMVIGQTDVKQQAFVSALPMKDVFVVIFFISVGMLFNPAAIVDHLFLFLSVLFVVLIIKPLTAFLLVILYRYPVAIALTIAIALAQIGEFSFILAEEAARYHLFPDEAFDVIVASAIISISLNPLFFKLIAPSKGKKQSKLPFILPEEFTFHIRKALLVGYGQVGQRVVTCLDNFDIHSIIVDSNVDTVSYLIDQKREAVYGDATLPGMLQMAKIEAVDLLIITLPDFQSTLNTIKYARELKPHLQIIARVRYKHDEKILLKMGIQFICCEEEEVSQSFDRVLSTIIYANA